MLKTYTLCLRGAGKGPDAFEPALCASDGEAMERARALLAANPDCEAVDVYFGDLELFRVI